MSSIFETGGANPMIIRDSGGMGSDVWNNPFMYLIFFALFAGWGNGGGLFGNGGANSVNQTLSNDFLFNNLNGKLESIQTQNVQGFSGLGNTMQQGFTNLGNTIQQGFTNIGNGLASSTYDLKSAIDSCCCTTQKNILESGYRNDLAIQAQTSALLEAGARNTQAILDKLCASEMREMQQANATLQAQLTACGTQNAINSALAPIIATLSTVTKNPQPAFIVPAPGCVNC